MWKTLLLVLPVLIPSWRFFKTIEPSPRVQWAQLASRKETPIWQEFRPKAQRISILQMLRRLFWNPDRNEALFIISCAERIQQDPTAHSIQEIQSRIRADLNDDAKGFIQFRLVFVHRENNQLVEDVIFTADPAPT